MTRPAASPPPASDSPAPAGKRRRGPNKPNHGPGWIPLEGALAAGVIRFATVARSAA